ncbi:hypothetical protein J3F84DRAFT_367113, partial [Trichoderma pleuroticola]
MHVIVIGETKIAKNKAIDSRQRYYTQLFGGAASLAAEPPVVTNGGTVHSLDSPNLETFHFRQPGHVPKVPFDT